MPGAGAPFAPAPPLHATASDLSKNPGLQISVSFLETAVLCVRSVVKTLFAEHQA